MQCIAALEPWWPTIFSVAVVVIFAISAFRVWRNRQK